MGYMNQSVKVETLIIIVLVGQASQHPLGAGPFNEQDHFRSAAKNRFWAGVRFNDTKAVKTLLLKWLTAALAY